MELQMGGYSNLNELLFVLYWRASLKPPSQRQGREQAPPPPLLCRALHPGSGQDPWPANLHMYQSSSMLRLSGSNFRGREAIWSSLCQFSKWRVTVGGNIKDSSHYGNQYRDSSKAWNQNYHMTQLQHSWADIKRLLRQHICTFMFTDVLLFTQ